MALASSSLVVVCLLIQCLVDPVVALVEPIATSSSKLGIYGQAWMVNLRQLLPKPFRESYNIWAMVALCGLLPAAWYLRQRREEGTITLGDDDDTSSPSLPLKEEDKDTDIAEAEAVDPGLLKKHSEIKAYSTSRFTYPKLRVFFRRHPQADKLPVDPAPVPLLVFIHGLGGSVLQFHPLLTSLVNNANCLAIDLPGCGLSSFAPKDWEAYTTESLTELLSVIIEDYRDKDAGQCCILIGHSMGASFAACLASTSSNIADHVVGVIGICPKSSPPSQEQAKTFRKLLWIPGFAFDLWRRYDRRGGVDSPSVLRFVGEGQDVETRKMQQIFNEQSRTPVWRRMASGSLPTYTDGVAVSGLPGRKTWSEIEVPIFLVAGESDNITSPREIAIISEFLGKSHPVQIEINRKSEPIPDAAGPVNLDMDINESTTTTENSQPMTALHNDEQTTEDAHEDPSTPNEELSAIPPQLKRPRKVLKTTILPAPASHALIYQPAEVRILAGLISDFLTTQVSPRLSLGWQLQFLSTSGKWDVKNLEKWKKVNPVSLPIAGVFRAMKTLREVDDTHCPGVFVRQYGQEIKDIVDISHESPVYDPRGLEKGGVKYLKFPTVSKIPPTAAEVDSFIATIDRIRVEQKTRAKKEGWIGPHYIGVHCHYGFNRTGYFVVCYLVERLGFNVQSAIDLFADKRPKGIKHAHFLDQLFVRYCKGLQRAPTM